MEYLLWGPITILSGVISLVDFCVNGLLDCSDFMYYFTNEVQKTKMFT